MNTTNGTTKATTTGSLIEATVSAMFPTYRYMSPDNRARFHRFCDDTLVSHVSGSRVGAVNHPLVSLLRLMDVDLIVVSESGSIVDGSNSSVAPTQLAGLCAAHTPAGESATKAPNKTGGGLDVTSDRDVRKLDKEFNKVIQKKDRRTRLLAFMRTGIRAEVTAPPGGGANSPHRSIDTIANLRKSGFNTSWKRLGAWHRRAALQTFLDMMDKAENTAFGIPIEQLKHIRDTIADPKLSGVSRLSEPTYCIKSGSITSLMPPSSGTKSSGGRVNCKNKRTIRPAKGRSRKKMNYLLQSMKKLRDKRRALENRSVEFTGTFVTIN